MPRKGENIFKRKDGRWEGRYIKAHEDGKAIYGYVFGKSYLEAKRKKSVAMLMIKPQKTHSALVKDIACRWLEELKPIRKKSTIVKYAGQLKNYILPAFGEMNLSIISNEKLNLFGKNLLKKLSPKTVSDILSRMKSIRRFALLHGYEVGYIPEGIRMSQNKSQIKILSKTDEKKLIAHLKNDLSPVNVGILLSLFTGIRLGELCALKWSDFSFDDKEFHIRRTMQRLNNLDEASSKKTTIEISEPKSQSSIRTIPIPEKFIVYLSQSYVEDSYVLSGEKNYFIEPRTMENRFKRILKKCGIQNINFHALRHTFATRCVEVGFDVKSLSEILGHANVNITLNRYVHPSMELKRESMNKLYSQSESLSE